MFLKCRTAAGRVYVTVSELEDDPVERSNLAGRGPDGRIFRSNLPGDRYDADLLFDDPHIPYDGS